MYANEVDAGTGLALDTHNLSIAFYLDEKWYMKIPGEDGFLPERIIQRHAREIKELEVFFSYQLTKLIASTEKEKA